MGLVRGRFAPSPTGEMHLGNAWTALLAWLHTRSQAGKMVLRMEDLDPDRSRREYAQLLVEDMNWLGLDWDEGPGKGGSYQPYYQSERQSLYEEALSKLQAGGYVYPCYCTRAELHVVTTAPHVGESELVYRGTCRKLTDGAKKEKAELRRPALRLAIPDEMLQFHDGLQGMYGQQLQEECGDFVVRRSDGVHAYQLAVVVDDGLMQISQVLRGDDLLASTPRQLLLFRLLGLVAPEFVHVPLLYGVDGHRLSKRHSSLSLASMRSRGVMPERVVGYLAWKAGQIERFEPVQAKELITYFSLATVPVKPVVADELFNGM